MGPIQYVRTSETGRRDGTETETTRVVCSITTDESEPNPFERIESDVT